MASVFKRTTKKGHTWYIQYRDPDGKKVRKAIEVKTKREAEIKLAQVIQELNDGSYQARRQQENVWFFEICDDFLDYGRQHKRSFSRDELTIKHLKTFFGDRPIVSMRKSDVEAYIAERRKALKPRTTRLLRPATINREISCLKTIFNRAIQDGKLENNPARYVSPLKENNVRNRVLSSEEFKRLMQCSLKHLQPLLALAYHTGMRRGELLGLTWDQIDFKGGWIYLKPEQTKTEEGRKIPLNKEAVRALSTIRKDVGLVFHYHGNAIKEVRKAFNAACKKAKIKDFRFHDLRHTFVTNMRRAGKQDRAIMAITGHKTMSVFTRYDTVDDEDLRKVVES